MNSSTGMLSTNALLALADLCKPPGVESDSEDELDTAGPMAKMGPADIAPKSAPTKVKSEPTQKKKDAKDIWDADELGDGAEYEEIYDPRPSPEYDIVYSQTVTSEDMFLGLSNKTPATASCETMVVKIKLPNTKGGDIQLCDAKAKFLDVRTPKFKLGLHLPHPVDEREETQSAKWTQSSNTLTVSLKMNREYDFINF